MSSLFQDGCGCGHKKHCTCGHQRRKPSPCKGCVCNQLMGLDKCNTFTNQTFIIVLKGDSAPLDMTGAGVGTTFTFVSFDPYDCCAKFSYTSAAATTETFVVDCRSIAGLSSAPTP